MMLKRIGAGLTGLGLVFMLLVATPNVTLAQATPVVTTVAPVGTAAGAAVVSTVAAVSTVAPPVVATETKTKKDRRGLWGLLGLLGLAGLLRRPTREVTSVELPVERRVVEPVTEVRTTERRMVDTDVDDINPRT